MLTHLLPLNHYTHPARSNNHQSLLNWKKMPLTKEQLLIPRVMCVGGKEGEPNYPGSQFKVGQVLTQCVLYGDEVFVHEDFSKPIYSSFAFKFPHLFRPMPWWEGRSIEDMPLFVKITKTGEVKMVEKYDPEYMSVKFVEDEFYDSLMIYTPATEQEYLEYQNRKINQ